MSHDQGRKPPGEPPREADPAGAGDSPREAVQAVQAVQRILVALEPGTDPAVLEPIAEMASRLRADLEALLIEDEDLLRFADFPHVRQYCIATGRSEDVTKRSLEYQLLGVAGDLERWLNKVSRRHGLSARFRVVRGRTTAETLQAHAEDFDLVAFGSSAGRPRASTHRSALQIALDELSKSVMLLNTKQREPGPIAAVLTDPETAGTVMRRAVRMADRMGRKLLILAALDDGDDTREEAKTYVTDMGLVAELHRIGKVDPERIGHSLTRLGVELAVIGPNHQLQSLIEHLRCQVLVVRD